MKDIKKTKAQLVEELALLRQRVAQYGVKEAERQQVEATLKTREEHLRVVVDNVPITLFTLDRDGVITFSQGPEYPVDTKPVDFVGLPVIDYFAELPLRELLARVLAGETITEIIEVFGFWVEVRASPLRDQDGAVIGVIGIALDVTERNYTEAALRDSEEKYRALSDHSLHGIFITDLEEVLYVNQRLCDISGYSADDFAKMRNPIDQLFLSEDLEQIWADAKRLVDRQLDSAHYEVRGVRKDGQVITIAFTAATIAFSGKRVIQGTIQDISQRKRTEEALIASEARLRTVLHHMPVILDAFDDQGNILVWNQECERVTGFSAEEIIGNPGAIALLYPDPEQRDQRRAMTEGKDYRNLEFNLTCKSGAVKTVSWSNISHHFAIPGWASWCIGVDVTERKQAEKQRYEAHQRYQTIFESNNDAICIVGLDGAIQGLNQRGVEMLGYDSVDDLIGRAAEGIIAPDEIKAQRARLATLLTGEILPVYEVALLRKDGSTLSAEVNAGLACDAAGYPSHVYNIVRDISERKQAEQRNLDLAVEQERVQILAGFIAKASHEFRTPLSIINTSAYLLDKVVATNGSREYLHRIENQVRDIEILLEDLTTMAQLDGGPQFILEEVDLAGIIEAVASALHPAIQDKNQRLILELHDRPLVVQGDAHFLKLAVSRIVENAVRFTPSKGIITLRANRVDSQAVVEISDTGPGIASRDLPHIFERFYRADVAGTTRGFGLGLPIARAVIDGHRGQIDVVSAANQGSVFRILLPVSAIQ